MKYIVIEHVEFSPYPGTNMHNAVNETLDWFYSSENSNARTATIRHLNGVKVTFERES